MLPIRRPEMTSWTIVLTCAFRRLSKARQPPGPESTLAPVRERHHDWRMRCERSREDLLVAGLGPLPYADRGAQVLARILGIVGPIKISELDTAAVDQRSSRQIELQCDVAQFIRLERLGLRQHVREQRPDRRKTCRRMSGRRPLHLGFVAFVE